MARPVGHRKTGGRNKGALNKRTEKLLSVLEERNYDPLRSLLEHYPKLDKESQVKIDLKLLEYVYPRLKEQNLEQHEEPQNEVSLGEKMELIRSLDNGEYPELAQQLKASIHPFNSFWDFAMAASSFFSDLDSEYLK